MSVPGSTRGSLVKSTLFLLFLLLLNAGTVLCQDEENGEDSVTVGDEDTGVGDPTDGDAPTSDDPEITPTMDLPPTDDGDDAAMVSAEVGSGVMEGSTEDELDPTSLPMEDQLLNPFIILIPVLLVALIIAAIVGGIVISRRCNRKVEKRGLQEEDPYLDASAAEKVPMPMFEEDVPSVLELEMEELDQWIQQDADAAKESTQT